MSWAIEHKNLKFRIKSIDSSGRFEGYAAVFGNVDHVGDMIEPGAFTKTLRENNGRFPILDQHAFSREIGFTEDAYEDSKGLYITGQLYIDDADPRNEIPEARAAYVRMKRRQELGRPMGLSIGYRTIVETMRGDVRVLKEVKLYEISTTPIPANELAGVTYVKSTHDLQSIFDILAQYRVQFPRLSDDEKHRLAEELKSFLALLSESGSEQGEPVNATRSNSGSGTGSGVAGQIDEPGNHSSIINEFVSSVRNSMSWVSQKTLEYELREFGRQLRSRG